MPRKPTEKEALEAELRDADSDGNAFTRLERKIAAIVRFITSEASSRGG